MQVELCGREQPSAKLVRKHPRQLLQSKKKDEKEIWNKWFSRVRLLGRHVRLEVPKRIVHLHPCKCERTKQSKERLFVYRKEPGSDLLCMHCNKKIELIS